MEIVDIEDKSGSRESQPDFTEAPEESSESHGSQPEEPEEAMQGSESCGSQPDSTEEQEESNQNVERKDSSQPPHSDTQSMSGTSAAPLGTRPFSDEHTQCVRLNSCIQAAASRLQDFSQNNQSAAERVRLLIQVIPRKPTFPLELGTFYAVLVAHIHRMLCERETVYHGDDWVMNEAMDMHHLQTGGTFMNVLTRKLDDIIVPCLAEIIAFVDRRSNLSLLQIEPSPLSQFWLKMFASKRSKEALRFTDMVTNQKVQMMDENFACDFPFSWLVKELLDSLWDSAQSTGGRQRAQVHRQLCSLVSDTPLGDILTSVQDGGQCEELYRRYLHDFVRSVNKCSHKMEHTIKNEYQLITNSLHNLVVKSPEFASIDGNISLVGRIAAVHVVYRETSQCIHWFGQLTFHRPGILDGLVKSTEQTAGQDDCMMLHLYAVERILSDLKPPIDAKRKSGFSPERSLRVWLKSLREMSNAIESTLSLPSDHPIAFRSRLHWQKIRAIQMFTEHVLLNHADMVVYAKRLDITLGSKTDFLKCSTIEKLTKALNNMHVQLKNKLKSEDGKKQISAIKRSCTKFFMEVVSGLCFRQSCAPEDQLVVLLLDIVFTEQREVEEGGQGEGRRCGTRDLTPFSKAPRDKQPVIRSFLLQLLLEHDTEKVKAHLKTYFERCQQALVGGMGVDQELSLLCTQCFENALNKEYCGLSLDHKMEFILKRGLLRTAADTLVRSAGVREHTISLDMLESVAKMRYSLLVVAELLQHRVNEQGHSQSLHGVVAHRLSEEARHACTDTKINTFDTTGGSNTTGPIVYLLKLLVCQAGFSCLAKIVRDPQLKWIVPKELEQEEVQKQKTLDPFVMYPGYTAIREKMAVAAYGRDYKEIDEHATALQPQECVPLLLSVYEVYTMSRASTNIAKQLLPETIEKMNEVIINCKALSRQMKVMARKLVSNEQGGPLAALQVSAGQTSSQQSLGALVVHTVAVLASKTSLHLLQPLVTLLIAPGNMAACYLPTMTEDMLPEARRVMLPEAITGGAFYECPNGHPYFVGECGRPMEQTNCITCGSPIGGVYHVRVANNRDARTTDATQTGHSLGHPTTRGSVQFPERSLSPAACCILRAIMHSALVWVSCNDDTATGGLVTLVKSGLQSPQELPEFFWGHLERDVQLLGRALGKNPEESAIVIHLVLKSVLTVSPPTAAVALEALGSREARNQWESQFSGLYINPILEKVESELASAMATILNDDKQDHDPLYYLVYERTPVAKGSLEPHLWGYRPRITLEHLTRYMQQQKKKFPILEEFLKNETVLQATQYIPDIVRLQKQMFHEFHHRIDHKRAHNERMADFIRKQPTENLRNEYQDMVASVKCAWGLVREKLKDHGRLKVEDKYLQEDLGPETALEYFIPTTTGPGACTFALVHYLTYIHNNFIDWCRAKSRISEWQEHKIQLPHIHKCHLLDYQTQLQSILLSHCHYSLRMGQGQEVTYNLPALEKLILDRFIHGKPTILVDIPHVRYQKDIYTAAMFAAVRKKVAPQKELPDRVKLDILLELGSPDKLRKCLDVVEIVMGFLSSGGGKPKSKLLSYLRKLKMERRRFSEKAKEQCNMEHIMSLWKTLSVGLARHITLSGQEPFHALNQELLKPLTESQCRELDKALPKFDLSDLLGTLYEFIETYIRHTETRQLDWGLLDILGPHLEASNLEPSPDLDKLPDDITLDQTATVWKYVVQFQAQQKER